MVLGPVSTDALNRASSTAYGAVTGVTQTVRNFGGSLGLAVLGSILITQNTSRVTTTLTNAGVPQARAHSIAHALSAASGRGSSAAHGAVAHKVALDFALSTRTVVYGMAGVMAAAFVLAFLQMPRGQVQEPSPEEPTGEPVADAAA
jgi:hypothetical protein